MTSVAAFKTLNNRSASKTPGWDAKCYCCKGSLVQLVRSYNLISPYHMWEQAQENGLCSPDRSLLGGTHGLAQGKLIEGFCWFLTMFYCWFMLFLILCPHLLARIKAVYWWNITITFTDTHTYTNFCMLYFNNFNWQVKLAQKWLCQKVSTFWHDLKCHSSTMVGTVELLRLIA